jgi:hypothetical protein
MLMDCDPNDGNDWTMACAFGDDWGVCTYPCEDATDCPTPPDGFEVTCQTSDEFPSRCMIECTATGPVCPGDMICLPGPGLCAWEM